MYTDQGSNTLMETTVNLFYQSGLDQQLGVLTGSGQGSDVFACAPTGSGKTLPFVCPMLMKLKILMTSSQIIQRASKDGVRAVILCPTQELASQTYRECKKLAKGKKFYIKLMTKQLSNTAEFAKFSCDVLISTPLHLKSSVTKRKLDLSRVEYLVLDESDKLFELGLVEPVDTVEELARAIMHDAVYVIIEPGDGVATIKRRRHDIHGDGVRDSATASGRGRLKVDLEPSTWRWRQEYKATPS
ncbi:DEAD-box ATP-dependent RNA helicase 57 [Tanacetum coccineum]